jgi:hypothetical protein
MIINRSRSRSPLSWLPPSVMMIWMVNDYNSLTSKMMSSWSSVMLMVMMMEGQEQCHLAEEGW